MRASFGLDTGCGRLPGAPGAGAASAAEPITVQLGPLNNSGESGNAVLSEDGNKTKVVVTITGAPAGVGCSRCTSIRGRARRSIPIRPSGSRR